MNSIIRLLFSLTDIRFLEKDLVMFPGFQLPAFNGCSQNSIFLQRFVASENHPTKFCIQTQHFGRNPLVFNQVFFNPGCTAWIPGVKSGALRLYSLHLHRDPVVPPAASRTNCKPYWLLLVANQKMGKLLGINCRTSHPPRKNINNYKTDHYFRRSSLFYRFGWSAGSAMGHKHTQTNTIGLSTEENLECRHFNQPRYGCSTKNPWLVGFPRPNINRVFFSKHAKIHAATLPLTIGFNFRSSPVGALHHDLRDPKKMESVKNPPEIVVRCGKMFSELYSYT